jgi:type II secretory ATPase GspE/PulE/Tfp pilus assembly ATPase PilB-like protein
MGRFLGNAEKFTDKQVAETLQMLVEHGVQRGTSDIHIEPHERFVLVRYRIDGALRGVHKLPRQAAGNLLAQLKGLAKLNIQENELPQEGRYEQAVGDQRVEVRVSTMPVFGGEKAVLHLSIERGKPMGLDSLGFWGEGLHALESVLSHPHGLVLVAGPRHNGVGSTLFSLLDQINTPLVSVATVETHHKHRLPGVAQTYLTPGLKMSDGLEAVLKQDPNIVMLSDLPDSTTSQLAIHAATTGHLVLAGVHADNAVTALLRLKSAGVEPFLLVTALRAAVSQRLVRTLCPNCRERYTLNPEEHRELVKSFGIATAGAFKRVHELEQTAAPAIFGDVKQLSSSPTRITALWRAKEGGCEHCDHTGYQGRTAIVEVLENTEALQKALLNHEAVSASSVHAAVLKNGFVPMALDGLVKALRGQTTVAEVLRAVRAV